MSVIQSIRDKYARWAVVAIALALLGFILMDAFASRSSLFGGAGSTIGSVNGHKIDVQEFEPQVKAYEDQMKTQGYAGTETRYQAVENVWNSEVERLIMADEFEKLGMGVSGKELSNFMFGPEAPEDIKRAFTDPNTGAFNIAAAQEYFNRLKKSGTKEEKQNMSRYSEQLRFQRMYQKYASLLGNSFYFPKWLIEKQNIDNNLLGKVAYVNVPYASIPDSAVKITDEEIKNYMSEHKADFEQEEETRSVSYINFSAAPTSADSAAIRNEVDSLKDDFAATQDIIPFLSRYGSTTDFFDGYLGKTKIQVPVKDSIFNLAEGAVYGPYLDGNNYVLAKLIDTKVLPDSAKARHILIQTNNPQTGQVMLDDSTAKKRIDSIKTAINNGASFDSLALKYSDDKGSAVKGGLLSMGTSDYFPQGQMVKAFNDFVFEKPVGSRDTVKTEFGYHLIEVLAQKDQQQSYKVAYYSKPIIPSPETEDAAQSAANQFAGESKDAKSFNDNYEKNLRPKGINRFVATGIKPNDFNVQNLGVSRDFVKSVYEADLGDVSQPQKVGQNYVVALVTEVNEAGMVGINQARTAVEPILRNQKKAAQIKQKLGKISTLEAASAAAGQPVQTADSIRFNGNNITLPYESRVVGAAFNPNNKGKVVPEAIEGQSGVFVLRVDNITTTPVEVAGVEEQRKMMEMQARQSMQYRAPFTLALKKDAKIKDNRLKLNY
jgi:peptidyl-prolyl cis-trans isomerase D